MYEDCLKSSRRLRERTKKVLYINHKLVKKEKLKAQKSLRNQKTEFDKQINDLEEKCKEKIDQIQNQCDKKLENLHTKNKSEMDILEADCREKIELLNNQIKSFQEDDDSLNDLTRTIFNCTTMKEILEIQRLVKNHQIDIVIQRHLKTLQQLFLAFHLAFYLFANRKGKR